MWGGTVRGVVLTGGLVVALVVLLQVAVGPESPSLIVTAAPPARRTHAPTSTPAPVVERGSGSGAGLDGECTDGDELPARPDAFCRFALGNGRKLDSWKDGEELRWTLVMTTYKGHRTLHNTLKSWAESGLLSHPGLAEAVVHINKCRCEDKEHTRRSFAESAPHLPLRIQCVKTNRIHPQALLSVIGAVKTPFAMMSENDRPTMRRTGESNEAFRDRVRGVLDLSLATASRPDTPFVLIHRFFLQGRDIEAYRDYVARRSRGENATLPPEVTRPHQYWDRPDSASCWPLCMNLVQAAGNKTALEALDAHCRAPPPAGTSPFCHYAVCTENALWLDPTGGSGAMSAKDHQFRELSCAPVWIRTISVPDWYRNAKKLTHNHNPDRPLSDPFVYCGRSQHWVNAPQVFNTKWYLTDLAGFMCRNKRNLLASGMQYKAKKPYFGYYGRHMEDFNIKYRAGKIVCHADGITDHIELEDYLFTKL
eukprot:Hpha_TRINITY_DN13793_c0_g1::TRINITY_DN13793_c0_g1_i6::g.142692::m.142692